MGLYDKILSDYLSDDGSKISDQKKTEIFDSLESILKEGPQSVPGIPIPSNLNFQPDGAYEGIDFKQTPFLKKFEEKVIDGLLKDSVKTLNLNGQTPFPLVFDTTGLLPNIPVPPNLNLSIPPTPIQVLKLLGVNEQEINDIIVAENLNIPQSELQELSLNELKQKLPEETINKISDKIKDKVGQIQPPPLSPDQLKDLFNPFKLIPAPPIIVPSTDFVNNVTITIQPILDTLNNPTISIDLAAKTALLNQITQLQQKIIQDHIAITTLPVTILTGLIAKIFSNIGLIANPLALVESLLADVILNIANTLFPNPPGFQVTSNQQIIMKIAASIVVAKFLLKAILSVLIGLILGKGLISQNASKLI
jgi:hypothetical protein